MSNLDLETHDLAYAAMERDCRKRKWRFASTEYHNLLDEVVLERVRKCFTLPSLNFRDQPDGIIVGDDFVFRVELKGVQSAKVSIPILPLLRSRAEFTVGHPVLYAIRDGSCWRCFVPGSPFLAEPSWTSANTTDRWSKEKNNLLAGCGKAVHIWPWVRRFSGDPWMYTTRARIARLPGLEQAIAVLRDHYSDLRNGEGAT